MGERRERCYAAALDADDGVSPIPVRPTALRMGRERDAPRRSGPRRGDLRRARRDTACSTFRDEGIAPRWRSPAGSWTPLSRSSRHCSQISDDPEYRATYAEILAARGDREAALVEAERAAAAYESLLARRPEAYADHAAAFFMGIGNRPQLAVDLASANWNLRDTPRSRRLLAKALRNARDVELCT